MSLARGVVALVCAAFAVALLWIFVEAITLGWAGVHVFGGDGGFVYQRDSLSVLAGTPADEAKIPKLYSIASFNFATRKTSRALIPLRAMETRALRPDR